MNKTIYTMILVLLAQVCSAQQPAAPIRELDYDDSTRITELFFSGLNAKAKPNMQQAGTYFKQIIDIDPSNDAALYELGNIYHSQNQEREAEAMANAAIKVNPRNEWYWALLADIYKRTGNQSQLIPVYDELIKLTPKKNDYYFDKATALLNQNKADEALAIYDDLEKRHGVSSELIEARQRVYQKQGKTEKASGELEKLVQSNPTDAQSYIELGQAYYNSGDKDKALQVLLKAKSIAPGNAFVRATLANLYGQLGKPEESYAELKSAFESSDLDADAKIRMMLTFLPQFKDAKGMEQVTSLAAILAQAYPSNAKALGIYGDLLFQQKKQAEALKFYKKALESDNLNYIIWENVIQTELNTSAIDAAIKDGEEATSLFPSQAGIHLYTGLAYYQKKNYEKAVSYLKTASALEIDDNNRLAQIYATLGDSYSALKNTTESDKAYEKAGQMLKLLNEKEPGNSSFEDTYAWVLFKQKKYREARTWIEKAIKDSKTPNATLSEHYGDILSLLGEPVLAVQQWTKAKSGGIKSEKLDRKINEKKYVE